MADLEEDYLDVLQNIEAAIIVVYQEQPELFDCEVDKALSALISVYKAEERGRAAAVDRCTGLSLLVLDSLRSVCDWRLGRATLEAEEEKDEGVSPEPLSTDEVIACLKRVRKSVQTWTRQNGRRGYLEFINSFIQ